MQIKHQITLSSTPNVPVIMSVKIMVDIILVKHS